MLYVYSSWRLLVITNVSRNVVICIWSSTAKPSGVCSGVECTGQGNDFELIPTIKTSPIKTDGRLLLNANFKVM